MKQIDQLIIIIPVILNLMGNLEMNLSARLGTAANIGQLDKPQQIRSLVLGNLSLLQLQAAVVSFVAACVSFIVGLTLPPSADSRESHIRPSSGNVTTLVLRQLGTTFLYDIRRPRPTLPSDGIRHAGLRE
jgi:solute carrier family 41